MFCVEDVAGEETEPVPIDPAGERRVSSRETAGSSLGWGQGQERVELPQRLLGRIPELLRGRDGEHSLPHTVSFFLS